MTLLKTLNELENWYKFVVNGIEILDTKESEKIRYYNPDGGFFWNYGRRSDFGCSQQFGSVVVPPGELYGQESSKPNFGVYEYTRKKPNNFFVCLSTFQENQINYYQNTNPIRIIN
jgi:hypothetical protein